MEHYDPQVDDYVIWTTDLGMKHEGWVYFKAEPSEPKRGWRTPSRYITIEIGVKPKPYCNYAKNDPHKMIHVLLVCYESEWKNLKYVKHRRVEDRPDNDQKMIDMYKSQDRPLEY